MLTKAGLYLMAIPLLIGLLFNPSAVAASTFTNPFIYADAPDNDVIRVGNVYYMTSTTMHMTPGVPIMKSYDLVNWEIVNYVYDTYANGDAQNLNNGQSEYGKGSWASSLRYHNGIYYVSFGSNSTGRTYIYQTADIENGPWTSSVLGSYYHDASLLFDNGRVFLVYGVDNISMIELTADAKAIKSGGINQVIIPGSSNIAGSSFIVKAEGAHIQKINGYYYVFLICWPSGSGRTQLTYRSTSLTGGYTGQVSLNDSGIAQGGIVDTPSGSWYAMLFRDSGAVGRMPYLVPVSWSGNWPVFGSGGKAPRTLNMPAEGHPVKKVYASDEFSAASASAELIVNGGFEEAGISPWMNNNTAAVAVTSAERYSGSSSVLVSGRQQTGAGLKQDLTGKVSAGTVYTFLAKVKYTTGPATKSFNLDIQNGPSYTGITILGSATLTRGEWGTIQGTYTLPAGADLSQSFIFVETPYNAAPDAANDLMNFYVDDVSFAGTASSGGGLAKVWQWNHNPDNTKWSLAQRPGFMRLTTGKVSTSILDARNTLTQRTFGPKSTGVTALETGGMKDGDYAGLAAFQAKYGFVGVKKSGNSKSIVMVNAGSGSMTEVANVPLSQNRVYLKVVCDFTNQTDKAYFYYSLDGSSWTAAGNTLQMSYTLPHFMGYRFALFNYATKAAGGYADFDYLRLE
ncbi:family 43 glycosylhydrolase [Paenibacillus tritici]|uniref:beta-xylosidase family glycoside hydrolase n=1 Tax=Paenibacillus tritici TaxID=1873425 RepID=UPI001BA50204|nr:family 43 glycosylhydrolase [Paenibacillus tritici]QUL57186.1 family 43 glycosylhydrolase [Paenibacillus tritici]